MLLKEIEIREKFFDERGQNFPLSKRIVLLKKSVPKGKFE